MWGLWAVPCGLNVGWGLCFDWGACVQNVVHAGLCPECGLWSVSAPRRWSRCSSGSRRRHSGSSPAVAARPQGARGGGVPRTQAAAVACRPAATWWTTCSGYVTYATRHSPHEGGPRKNGGTEMVLRTPAPGGVAYNNNNNNNKATHSEKHLRSSCY